MAGIDPFPRSYAKGVRLRRRSQRVPGEAGGAAGTLADLEVWLLGEALAVGDVLDFFEAFCWRMVRAMPAFERASLHVGTLHPQIYGFAWNWEAGDGICDEIQVAEDILATDAYRRSPIFAVIERGEAFDRTIDEESSAHYPLLRELGHLGYSHYMALPLTAAGGTGGGGQHNLVSLATRQPGGFTETERAGIDRLLSILALHVARHIDRRISANLLDAYLGPAAGGKVLQGSIRRGVGEEIDAVIWMSDLRGFTDLSARLPGPAMTALLNAYFERLAGAVIAEGGEILKFMGDGVLAVFPQGEGAASAALRAARAALAGIAALNAAPPAAVAGARDIWAPLRTGIALHEGTVFFGNVGSAGRLDFTVIGPAVNAASRIEALTKELGREILISQAAARGLDVALDDLGEHRLRGVAEPVHLFSPKG